MACRAGLFAASFAGLLVSAGLAHAGNEDELFVGNRASLTGGAMTATVDDGSATWYNPAGLAAMTRQQVDVSGTVYSLRFYDVDGFVSSRLGGREDTELRELVAAPTQVAYVRELSDDVNLGLGYFVPRTANLVLREHLEEQVGPISSEWTVDAIAIYSQYVFGATVAYRMAPNVRIGGGLLGIYETLTEAASVFGSVRVDGDVERIAQADQLTTQALVGLEPVLGLQVDVTKTLTLAGHARGPRFSVYNGGKIQSNVSAGTVAGSGALGGDSSEVGIQGAPLEIVRSGRYYAGAALRTGEGWVALGADLQPSLIDQAASVFRDTTWNARLGTYQPISRSLAVGAGVFTDRATEASRESPRIFTGANFYGGSLGAELSNRRELDESQEFDSMLFTTTLAFRYAYAAGTTLNLQVDPTAEPSGFFREVDGDVSIHELSVYVGSGLAF